MKKNKVMVKKKKQKKLKRALKKPKFHSDFGPIQISCSDENGDEVILLDRTEEWKETLK